MSLTRQTLDTPSGNEAPDDQRGSCRRPGPEWPVSPRGSGARTWPSIGGDDGQFALCASTKRPARREVPRGNHCHGGAVEANSTRYSASSPASGWEIGGLEGCARATAFNGVHKRVGAIRSRALPKMMMTVPGAKRWGRASASCYHVVASCFVALQVEAPPL